MENKKKDELQNRREFFKKAAKGALPILGTIALANISVSNVFAGNKSIGECDDCYGGCMGSCHGKCSGNCKGHCNDTCMGSCDSSCHGNCSDVCKN